MLRSWGCSLESDLHGQPPGDRLGLYITVGGETPASRDSSLLLRPSPGWVRPTLRREGDLLYSKSLVRC